MCFFNVNFNVFFKSIKVHLLVSELYIYQNARCKDKNYHLCFYILDHSQNMKLCSEFKRSSLLRVTSESNGITSTAIVVK